MRPLLGIVLLSAPAAAQLSDPGAWPPAHGPLVVWRGDPTTSAEIVWIERALSSTTIGWRSGPAGFGYGDGDDATELRAMGGAWPRLAIRHVLDAPEEVPESELVLVVRYDDAFIAWLNGEEIGRFGVDRGSGAEAEGIHAHEAEAGEARIVIAVTRFRPGANVLALEGHNADVRSSDFTLDPRLVWVAEDHEGDAVIAPGAEWSYLAGRDPRPGWRELGFEPGEDGDAAPPEAVVRRAWVRGAAARDWRPIEATAAPFGESGSTVRRAWVDGLEPGTRYALAVGAEPPSEADACFETAPADPAAPIRFVAGGDMYHRREHLDAMNRRAGLLDPTFALLGGDLAYANGTHHGRWYEWVDSWVAQARTADARLIPMVVAIGNHEVRGAGTKPNERAQFYYPLFASEHGLPFFTVDVGERMSIFVLDSGHTHAVAGAQAAWLDEALGRRAHHAHLVAVYHRPAYGTAKGPAEDVRRHWVPLFQRHGLDVAFENDHHTYKRTHPLIDGQPAEGGILYLGDGAWGVGLRAVPEPGTVPYLAHAESRRHLILTTLEGGTRRYEAIDADGVVFDRWPQ